MASGTEKRKINNILDDFDKAHTSPSNRFLQWIYIPLLTFGLLGLVWSIPFPHLEFLGRYNGFVNWASFLIAFAIYYYYKVSPLLSYGILLIVFAFSAGIVGLEKAHINNNWPMMGTVCLLIFTLGLILQFAGSGSETKPTGFSPQMKTLLDSPLWLMSLIFRKAGVKVR
ncbi:MAG: DUF962 domain-containing protein [Sphingobacteriaceae bacterium]|nr:DUF962 domain-containing protein [Sphingobacteriaceae bacterium]